MKTKAITITDDQWNHANERIAARGGTFSQFVQHLIENDIEHFEDWSVSTRSFRPVVDLFEGEIFEVEVSDDVGFNFKGEEE